MKVKVWLQNLGLGERVMPIVQDDKPVTLAQEENLSAKSRWLLAFPISVPIVLASNDIYVQEATNEWCYCT